MAKALLNAYLTSVRLSHIHAFKISSTELLLIARLFSQLSLAVAYFSLGFYFAECFILSLLRVFPDILDGASIVSVNISAQYRMQIPWSNHVDSLYRTGYIVFLLAFILVSSWRSLDIQCMYTPWRHGDAKTTTRNVRNIRNVIHTCWNLLNEGFPMMQSAPRTWYVLQVARPLLDIPCTLQVSKKEDVQKWATCNCKVFL